MTNFYVDWLQNSYAFDIPCSCHNFPLIYFIFDMQTIFPHYFSYAILEWSSVYRADLVWLVPITRKVQGALSDSQVVNTPTLIHFKLVYKIRFITCVKKKWKSVSAMVLKGKLEISNVFDILRTWDCKWSKPKKAMKTQDRYFGVKLFIFGIKIKMGTCSI